LDLYSLAKPILFRLEAERAHALGLKLMGWVPKAKPSEPNLGIRTSIGELANPLGLAGGFDKTGRHLLNLARLGFGYLVAGTITLQPWPGNPKPRVVRNVKERTLVNSLGFPNPGVDEFLRNLSFNKPTAPVVASISGREVAEIVECYVKVQPDVVAVEVNLSSPNTPRLRDLREIDLFQSLAADLSSAKRKPTFLKVPPLLDERQFEDVLRLVGIWENHGFEGVTACNARPVTESRLATGTGGYSGPPLFPNLLLAVKKIRKRASKQFEINAVGGIGGSDNVKEALAAGATTVQLYTALVYEGPRLVPRILDELARTHSHS
jgi:dihydroorotate dehydrogenase